MQSSVRGEDLPVVGTKRPAVHIRHCAAGLCHNDRPGGDIPWREALFPVAVEATGGDIAKIEGGGARLPYGLHASQEVTPDFSLLLTAREIVRKTGHED